MEEYVPENTICPVSTTLYFYEIEIAHYVYQQFSSHHLISNYSLDYLISIIVINKKISKIKIGISHICYECEILTHFSLALSYKICNLKLFGIKSQKKIQLKSLGNSLIFDGYNSPPSDRSYRVASFLHLPKSSLNLPGSDSSVALHNYTTLYQLLYQPRYLIHKN